MRRAIRSSSSVWARSAGVLALVAGMTLAGVPATSLAAGCVIKPVAHPEVGGTPFDQLYGIDALSATNIWAVGSSGAADKTLVEHWNGAKWSIVPSPSKGSIIELQDVTAIGPSNAWAVGYFFPSGGGHLRTLVEHWNGTKWTIVASPNPISGSDNVLNGVDAVSASNVWAVGANGQPGAHTIILHFNGSRWVTVPGAPLANGGGLQDVSAISKTNVIAVGHAGITGGAKALIERFDGQKWKRLPAPVTSNGDSLAGVSTPAADAQWGVGSRSGTAVLETLTMRNTGSGWQPVTSPNVGTGEINILNDVSALSAGNAWAVGEHENASFVRRTLVEHFANGHWSVVSSPNSGTGDNKLFGVETPTSTRVWAVGTASHPIGSTGLILRGC
jgi:hypothetical protein